MHARHTQILDLVNSQGRITVVELSQQLNVSEVTIRQDLTQLESQGLLRRVHGAAIQLDSDNPHQRQWANTHVKQLIAKAAAELVRHGESVLIEGGSTNALLARLLASRDDIVILTASSYIAHQLRQAKAEVILLGGQFQTSSESLVGPLTRLCIEHVHFSKAFIGVDGFQINSGFTNRNMMRADVANAILAKGQENIILTDASKFGRVQPGAIGPLCRIRRVITDNRIPAADREWLTGQGIDVLVVEA